MSTPESPRIGVIDTYPHQQSRKSLNPSLALSRPLDVAQLISVEPHVEDLSRLGFHVVPDVSCVVEKETFDRPRAFADTIKKAFSDAYVSHVMVVGNQRIPEEIIQRYEGKIARAYPGGLDPLHVDTEGKPLDFGRLEGIEPTYANLAFMHIAEGPYATSASLQHITSEDWTGELVAVANISYSWIGIKRAGSLANLQEKGMDVFFGKAQDIHRDVLGAIPRAVATATGNLSAEKDFPKLHSSQKLIPDGKEHLLYTAREFAQKLSK